MFMQWRRFKGINPLHLLIFMLLYANFSFAANFHRNYNINIGKKPLHTQAIGKVNILKLTKMPDLVVNNLIISDSRHYGRLSGRVYIKNIGKKSILKSFYFSLQKLDNLDRWQAISQACFKINVSIPLRPGQTISKDFLFNYNPGDKKIKIRAYADSACENETPYTWRDIKESNENNNYSAVKTISGFYNPYIAGLHPYSAVIGKDTIYITGRGFGERQNHHQVILNSHNTLYEASIVSWGDGAIYFKASQSIPSGEYKVYVGQNHYPLKLSLYKESVCPWRDFIDKIEEFYNLIGDIHIDTKKHGTKCSYQNNSTETVIGAHAQLETRALDVKKMQFHIKGLGDYRYNIQDLNADTRHVRVIKYSGSQFLINIPFESRGVEVKGCFKSIAGGGWQDSLAPDIHINNMKLSVAIKLIQNNGTLTYKAATSVSANIKADKKINTAILNLFVKLWKNRVRRGIINGMNDSINNDRETRKSIINGFMYILHSYSTPKIPLKTAIKNIRFKKDGIYTTY